MAPRQRQQLPEHFSVAFSSPHIAHRAIHPRKRALRWVAMAAVVGAPQVEAAFPAVLQRLRVSAFDLGTLITPVLDSAPEIPQPLRDHLSGISVHIVQVGRAAERLKALMQGRQLQRASPKCQHTCACVPQEEQVHRATANALRSPGLREVAAVQHAVSRHNRCICTSSSRSADARGMGLSRASGEVTGDAARLCRSWRGPRAALCTRAWWWLPAPPPPCPGARRPPAHRISHPRARGSAVE